VAAAVVPAALAFANRHPASDMDQVFQPQRGLRVFGMRNKLLCNRMVNPPPKAGFLPGHLLQATPSRFRAGGLIDLCSSRTALAYRFDLCARIAMTI
jgi:hypothetical protein